MNDLRPLIKQSPPVDTSAPYDPSTLRNKYILITGASNGLGAMLARSWASHGAHIAIGDIDDSAGEDLVASLRAAHPDQTFFYHHCDVLSWESQTTFFEAANRAAPSPSPSPSSAGGSGAAVVSSGGIDIVVPNAGVHIPAEAQAFEALAPKPDGTIPRPKTKTLDINIQGAYLTIHLALHYFSLSKPSSQSSTTSPADKAILLIGSVAGLVPLPGQVPYVMSKHAITGLFRSLRASTPAASVRVNMIAPYFVSGSNMVKPIVEAIFLGGASGAATHSGVLDAATRLIADTSIRGRALVVGPKVTDPDGLGEGKDAPLSEEELARGGREVWECYADDYDEVEAFRWRYVKFMNAVAQTRGWIGWLKDILTVYWR